VPDQRGYNLSSKPSGVAAYALTELVSDVMPCGSARQKKIFLGGHDWGAAVAWSAALLHPQRVAKLVVLNVPHPSVMRKFMKTRLRQVLRSWYIFFFSSPGCRKPFCQPSISAWARARFSAPVAPALSPRKILLNTARPGCSLAL